MPAKEYEYRVEDRSIFYPWLKRYLWTPLLRFIPAETSPNTLTLLGNVCVALSVVVLLSISPDEPLLYLVPAGLTFLYLCLDNMDGLQARRQGQGSPLGEFLDHYLDCVNAGTLMLAFSYSMRLPDWAVVGIVSSSCFSFFATMWEQRHTGWLRFGAGGNVEGLVYLIVTYVAVALLGHDAVAATPILGTVTYVHASMLFFLGMVAVTVLGALSRVGRAYSDYAPYVFLVGTNVAWFLLGNVSLFAIAALIILANVYLGGREIIARLRRTPYEAYDPLLLAGSGLFALGSVGLHWSAEAQNVCASLLIGYLVCRVASDFAGTVMALREHVRPGELLSRLMPRLSGGNDHRKDTTAEV